MSKNLNISVLVAARDEYIEQLKSILVPLLIQGFNSIYADAKRLSNEKQIIWKFQELLKQIPQWNQTILQEESKRIKRKCPYIMDIVTAIFVTNVKILASVRLKGNRNDIRVKIPTSDIFFHSIYIESAQQIFYDPFLFYDKLNNKNNYNKFNYNTNIQENKHHVKAIIEYSIDETIRQMLPFDDILQKYLADALNDNAEFNENSESEDETVSDSDEESINLPSDESEYDYENESEENDNNLNEIKSFKLNNGKINLEENSVMGEEEILNEEPQNFIEQNNNPVQQHFFNNNEPIAQLPQMVQQPPIAQPPPIVQQPLPPVQQFTQAQQQPQPVKNLHSFF